MATTKNQPNKIQSKNSGLKTVKNKTKSSIDIGDFFIFTRQQNLKNAIKEKVRIYELTAMLKTLTIMEELSKEKQGRDEEIWNSDLIFAIQKRLEVEFSQVKVIKGKVLKDIFLHNEKGNYSLQFGFVDQDIIIYHETMDITDLQNSENIKLHKNNLKNSTDLIIPQVICELKYNGITSHGLIIYSEYAAQIKSIFPDCKYFLAMKYKKSSTINKLFRHGRNFDKIVAFENGKSKRKYKKGDFLNELENNTHLGEIFDEFINEIKKVLQVKETHFMK